MAIREPFSIGEWYHCYNRGVDKRKVFQSRRDYQRFLQALYLANTRDSIHQTSLRKLTHRDIFSRKRGEPIVSIGAYCLMPNHFHLVLQEISDNGISKFMQKIGTAYTMYFNIKNERTGNLFLKPFRARHITDDAYFSHIPHYVHLNAAELYERGWKKGIIRNMPQLQRKMRGYEYSSLLDYEGMERSERSILDAQAMELFQDNLPIDDLLNEAAEYYQNLAL